jgi:acyl carrier protein
MIRALLARHPAHAFTHPETWMAPTRATPAELEHRIRRVIRDEFQGLCAAGPELAADTPLVGQGLGLDSVEALVLATAIEREFDIVIEDDELTLALFTSVRTLADHVAGKLRRDAARA